MSLVEARDLFRFYATPQGTAVALQGLTLDVHAGELLVVFGPSGSGKSTLLRILAGLDRPTAGAVRVAQHDLRTLRGRALLEYRSRALGYADQHYTHALAPELSARELVPLRLALLGAPRAERERVADELLERIGLRDRADARPHELSGGERQRIAVAAALAHRPRLFVADEPTGELDAANARLLYALIRELAHGSGATTVLVSHDPGAAAIADRVVQIRDGRVSAEDGAAVVNRGGWVRVPGLREGTRVRGAVELDEVERRPRGAPAAAAGEVVARLAGVAKAYGRRRVLDAVDLEVRAGALTAVTGRSGSGKSTLLHLLAGLDVPDAGEVDVLGTEVAGLDETARARLRRAHVGVVAQGTELVPFLSALETVELALELRGRPRRGAGAALAAVGLAELAGQRVARLSFGERQRVAVARALASRPELLLADEPTARLDEENARAIGALLARLAREHGTAVVCATHDPALVEHATAELSLASLTA
ncbi:MAG TPA: ATP-binding cassette domain-containing protein [Gaiellaceae bacterium]|nr:ATP-binding cassette domain-containing protein [Gaiellaceae bacterium]